MFRLTTAALILSAAAVPAFAQTPAAELSVIVTQGEATVKHAPDQAWVSISAEARAPKPADAQKKAADAMTALQAALKTAGIAADAIKTTNYSLQPDMEYANGTSRLKGYYVLNQVEVRVDALAKIGDVLDAAGSSGATSIAGLRFDLKDRGAVEREALTLAVRDAMARAQAMAAGAGRALGPIVRIEEQRTGSISVPRPFMSMARVSGAAADTPIAPGETEIRIQVTLTVAMNSVIR